MISTMLAAAFCLGALFDVQSIPLDHPNTRTFLAQADADSTADVFVLAGHTLIAYSSAESNAPLVVQLADNTSVFDVADIDGDRRNEVIAVCGERIVRYALAPANQVSPPQDLFSLHTQLSVAVPEPSPFVLVLQHDGKPVIALPCENTFELRSPEGTLLVSYPIGEDAMRRVSYGSPFLVSPSYPPHIGKLDALEFAVSRSMEFVPELPADLAPVEITHTARRRGTWSQTRDAIDQEEDAWPWFPLQPEGPSDRRALYAFAPPDYRTTAIRIREFKSPYAAVRNKDLHVGPERRYPGNLIALEGDLPDFNHDGWIDLLLWSAPEPGMSVDAITRAITSSAWPVRLTTHLFVPEENRFAPTPSAHFECTIPILWFLTPDLAGPLRNIVLRDFNGDGRTDLGCCVAPNRFCVWLYGENGFNAEPDFAQTFPDAITGVDFRACLDGQGRTSLGLRASRTLYVLRAIAPPVS